jgi:hypothetical protein
VSHNFGNSLCDHSLDETGEGSEYRKVARITRNLCLSHDGDHPSSDLYGAALNLLTSSLNCLGRPRRRLIHGRSEPIIFDAIDTVCAQVSLIIT